MEISTNIWVARLLAPVWIAMAAGFAVYGMCRHVLTGEDLVIQIGEEKGEE